MVHVKMASTVTRVNVHPVTMVISVSSKKTNVIAIPVNKIALALIRFVCLVHVVVL